MASFKLVAVMSILNKELHVLIDVDVDDNGNLVDDVMLKLLEVLFGFAHLQNSL